MVGFRGCGGGSVVIGIVVVVLVVKLGGIMIGISLPNSCEGCGLSGNGRCGKFQGTDGGGRLKVMLVGDWGGDSEAATGLPFRPRTQDGSALEGLLSRMGRRRDDFVVVNLLRCRPPYQEFGRDPRLSGAIEHCRENLREAIRVHQPKVLVAFGDVVTAALTGLKGYKQGVKDLRGYLLPSVLGVPVVPTFHPRRVARGGANLTALVMRDVSRAVMAATTGEEPITSLDQLIRVETGMDGLEEILRRVKADPGLLLAVDLETQESANADDEMEVIEFNRDELLEPGEVSLGEDEEDEEDEEPVEGFGKGGPNVAKARIKTIQFAVDGDWGVSVPWEPGYIEVALELLETPNPKVAHNGEMFDWPILRRHGAKICGVLHDSLIAFRNLQPELPAGLQTVTGLYWLEAPPWKHMSGTNFEAYGVMDVVALIKLWPRLKADLEKLTGAGLSAWEGYEMMTRPMRIVLDDMAARGIPVDEGKLGELREWLTERIDVVGAELQKIAPPELRKRQPNGGYTNWPADMKARAIELIGEAAPEVFASTTRVYKNGSTKEVKAKWTAGGLYQMAMAGEWPGVRVKLLKEFPKYEIGQFGAVNRLYQPVPFNPGSTKQMIDYLKLRKFPVPTKFKDGKETTGDREMERLWVKTRDPLIGQARELRALDKLRSSYTGKLKEDGTIKGGWVPGADGRLRSTVGYTATWQLAARNPNCFGPDTEILTEAGWLEFKDLCYGMKVAQFRETDRSIEWVLPTGYVAISAIDGLVEIETDEQISLQVTPDHDCLVQDRKTGMWKKVSAIRYPKDGLQWHAGKVVDGVSLRGAEVTVMAAMQADGHIRKDGMGISFGFKKARKIERLETALKELGVEYSRYDKRSGVTEFYLPRRNSIFDRLCAVKQFDSWILKLGAETLDLLVREVQMWDGSERNGTYFSSVRSNADWVQAAATLAGWRASVREYRKGLWTVNLTNKPYSSTANRTVTPVPYDGQVYCVSVPSGNIVVRRNGRVAITGNCMTLPKRRKDLAQKFRDCIRAEDGHQLVEIDYTAFHAKTLGLEARSASYMRLAALDIHSYVTGHLVRWPGIETALDMGDGDLKQFLDEIRSKHKDVRDFKAKPSILGIGFGMGIRRLFFENRDSFTSESEARKLMDLIRSLFPEVFAWQDRIVQEAKKGYLISKWGAVRRMLDVTRWQMGSDGWKEVAGKGAEKAKAFLPANDAHGMLRWKLLEMHKRGWLERYELVNIVHDAVVFHPKEELAEECVHQVGRFMLEPVMQLADEVVAPGGFACGAEASIGKTLAALTHIEI